MDQVRAHAETALATLLFFLAIGLFLFQGASLLAPIVHEQHNWRQADVFSVAYSFHNDGFDFLHPKIDFWRGPTGIVGMEAPVYPTLVHAFMFLFGDHPRTARIVSGLCFWLAMALAASIFVPRDAEPVSKKVRGAAFLAAGFLSPMGLMEFRNIQPDGTAVSLTLVAACLCLLYGRTEQPKYLIGGVLIYSLAAITKSPVLVAGPALWMLTFSEQRLRIQKMAVRGLPFLIPLAAYFIWFRWAGQLTKTYEQLNPYFNLVFETKEVTENLANFGLYPHVFGFLLGSYAVNWVLFPAFLSGIVLSMRRAEERALGVPMAAWLFFGMFFLMCFAFRTTVHWYYAMVVFPPAAYFTGVGLANVLELGRRPATTVPLARIAAIFVLVSLFLALVAAGSAENGQKVPVADGAAFEKTWFHSTGLLILAGVLAVSIPAGIFVKPGWIEHWRIAFQALALAAGIVVFPRAVHDAVEAFKFRTASHEWEGFDDKYAEARRAVEQKTTREDLFLVDGYQPYYLHLIRRRGFASEPGTARALGGVSWYIKRGARYYLHHAENGALEEARRGREPIARGSSFELYCIDPNGCGK